MPLISMNEMTTFRWSFEEDVERFVKSGFAGIGVWLQKLADFGEERGIELLADSQLKVSNLLWAGGFTGSDGRTYRESIDDALEAVRWAAAMNAGCLVVYTGARAGHTHNHARRLVRGALAEVAAAAAEYQVTLALEPMHAGCAADCTFITSLDDALTLIGEVDSPQLKLAFDTYHLGYEPNLVLRIPEIVGQIAVVRVADGKQPPTREQNRLKLLDGTLPLREIFAALAAANYDGPYDVLLLGEDVESTDYWELLEHSRGALARLTALQEV